MKTYRNLYDKLCSMDNLMKAFKGARKGKSKKHYVMRFEANLGDELHLLQQELETLSYRPKPIRTFVIQDPKTRVISASHFRDRVVHHAVCRIIEPIFEKTFIYDSYANRKGKGTHAALKRFDIFKRKVTSNGKPVSCAKDTSMVRGYVLKADIKHYFASVDHRVMLGILDRRIKDNNVLWLIEKILENHNGKTPGRGMPIGNLTSQFFANLYLNELDHFVKHTLRARFYIRYVDDFVILDRSREMLVSYKVRIEKFLKTLKLELHPEKSQIFPLHRGVNLLGYRIFYHHMLLKKSNLGVLQRRMRQFDEMHERGEISREKIIESLRSWMVYASYGNTHKLRKRIFPAFR